jgi:hypothetical protein
MGRQIFLRWPTWRLCRGTDVGFDPRSVYRLDVRFSTRHGMFSDLVTESLAALSRCANPDERIGLLRQSQRLFLDRPDEAAVLARRISEVSPDSSLEDPLSLLVAVLDEARMGDENGLSEGADLLRAVTSELERLATSGALAAPARAAVAQAFVRAGLEPPPAATLDHELMAGMGAALGSGPAPDLGKLIDEVREAVGDEPLQLHAGLAEIIASLPPPARAIALAEIAALPQANFSRLGSYWLLDRIPEVRQAAAAFYLGRARTSGLSVAERARLVAVRKWLPRDAARDLVDQALRETLGKDAEASSGRPPKWKLHRIAACLPDGAGAQSAVIAGQVGSRRGVSMLLVKAGHGVKDAFVVPCGSAAEQKRLLRQVVEQTQPFDVDRAHVCDIINRALEDGAAAGLLPAPGLVDVAEMLGEDLVPSAPNPAAIMAAIDADAVLAGLSPQKRARLVKDSAAWPERYSLLDTWFEDTAAVRDLLDHGGALQRRRVALWRHLESRREWWAMTLARAAATIKSAQNTGDAWLSFAATSLALLDGHALKKIPIMTAIVARSIEASDHRYLGLSEICDGDEDDEAEEPILTELVTTEPEQPGEFEAYLANSTKTSAWFDGWLVAIAVAPNFVTPTTWLGSLLGELSFASHDALQRFLDILVARMNAANHEVADADVVAKRLERMDIKGRSEWAAGFSAFVEAYPSAWPRRGRTRDDQRMLAVLAEPSGAGIDPTWMKLIGTWISCRHARRAGGT